MKKQIQSIQQDVDFGGFKMSAADVQRLFETGSKAQQNR